MIEDSLRHYPLGEPVPSSPHAVCVSIPTMRDVIGYETKDAATMSEVRTGYPRFVTHPFSVRACDWFAHANGLSGRAIFALNSSRNLAGLTAFLGTDDVAADECEGMTFAHFPDSEMVRAKGKLFLQHAGCGASSRRAEDFLVRMGQTKRPHEEEIILEDPDLAVRRGLSGIFSGVTTDEIMLAASGMNAFHALFQGIRETRIPQGRKLWVQLGWLYVDTILILQKFLGEDEELVVIPDISDGEAIRDLLEARGHEVAAVVTETPTNPLMQTCDLVSLHQLCERSGALLIADPTAASPCNVDVLPHCAALVNSLTKYSGNEGDVMLGSLVFSPSSKLSDLAEIRERSKVFLEPPFVGDLRRLAWQIPAYEDVVRQGNFNVMRLVSFLEERPEIRKIHWAYSQGFKHHYERIARGDDSPGCLFSLELNLPMHSFYDSLRLLKSPSFGCRFSLACPYLYLAHYDLVSSVEGQNVLRSAGMGPDLVRISVGMESADDLIEVFAEALGLAARNEGQG